MNRRKVYMFTILLICCIPLGAMILPSDNLKVDQLDIYSLNENWQVTLPDGKVETANLPAKYDVNTNSTYWAERVFEDDFPQGMSLRLALPMQYVKVYIENQLIFENIELDENPLKAPHTSVWYFVKLPKDVKGKTLRLEIRCPLAAFSGRVHHIQYGQEDSLKMDLFTSQINGIMVALVILFIGLILLGVGIVLSKSVDLRFFFLGLFSIFTSVWLLSEMDLLQFLIGNRFIIGGISYMVLPLMGATFIQFIRIVVLSKYERVLHILSLTFLLLYIVNFLLQIFNKVYFIESIFYVNLFMLISIVLILCLLFFEWIVHQNKQARKYILFLSVFIASIVTEIMMFVTGAFTEISSFIRVGFITFIGLLIFDSLKYLREITVNAIENETLRRIAYQDILTGGYNRAAFEKEIDKRFNDEKKLPFRLIMTDLNHLKQINDTFGHIAGDQAIRRCYECLVEAFDTNDLCFRLGGDEFACIVDDINSSKYLHSLENLHKILEEENKNSNFTLEIAIGSGIYNFDKDRSFSHFFHEVDGKMYRNKLEMKK